MLHTCNDCIKISSNKITAWMCNYCLYTPVQSDDQDDASRSVSEFSVMQEVPQTKTIEIPLCCVCLEDRCVNMLSCSLVSPGTRPMYDVL